MPRWIVFDPRTADAVRSYKRPSDSLEVRSAEAAGAFPQLVLRAAAGGVRATCLLPGDDGCRVRLISAHAPAAIQRAAAHDVPVAYTAGGFLGLDDEPIYEDEIAPRKPWWRRMWD